jgi:hypothetical protein
MLPNFSDQLYIGSLLVQIPAGQSSATTDKSFAFGTKPVGAIVIVADCKYGDVGKLEVIHPQAGVVGELGTVHLPEGQRDITVANLNPNTEVPVGLSYRFTLTAVDTNGRNIILWLLVKK